MSPDAKAIVDALRSIHDILWWCAVWLFVIACLRDYRK